MNIPPTHSVFISAKGEPFPDSIITTTLSKYSLNITQMQQQTKLKRYYYQATSTLLSQEMEMDEAIRKSTRLKKFETVFFFLKRRYRNYGKQYLWFNSDAHQVGISQLCPALKPDGTICNCPYSAHLSAPPQQLSGNLVYCSLDIAIYAIRDYAGSHIFNI